MSNESEDGVVELLELKRNYKEDCEELEAEIKTRLGLEEQERKNELTAAYVERLVEAIAERIKPLLWEVLKS